jgi:hypothetical protein
METYSTAQASLDCWECERHKRGGGECILLGTYSPTFWRYTPFRMAWTEPASRAIARQLEDHVIDKRERQQATCIYRSLIMAFRRTEDEWYVTLTKVSP